MKLDKSKYNILAIETSCDETAAAVVEVQRQKYGSYKSYEAKNKNSPYFITNNSILHTSILSNVVASQINLHKKYGGVFPEIASRAHTEKIINVVQTALEKVPKKCFERSGGRASASRLVREPESEKYFEALNIVDAITVTSGPGLIGSLLVGVNFAKTYAFANKLPIIGINHWLGHIYSCFPHQNVIHGDSGVISSDSLSNEKSRPVGTNHNQSQSITFPLLALIVSGGHTGLVLMKSHKEIIPLGETLDDAAGEAFDKVAKILGLEYPGGPSISRQASKFLISKSAFRHAFLNKSQIPNFKFPRSMLDSGDYNFSFSGLKTAVLYKVRELESLGITINHYQSHIAFEFQQAVIDILVGKTIQAAREFKPKSILLCGGVSANKELREQLGSKIKKEFPLISYFLPPISLSTDNAAMIGIAAVYHLDEISSWDKIHADSNLKL